MRAEVADEARVVLEVEETASHPEQMLDCHSLGCGDGEVGKEVSNRVVEAELTLRDELERDDRCECLRGAAHAIVALGGHRGPDIEIGQSCC